MTDQPISDDARAARAWSAAFIAGVIRHVAPGFWPIAVNLALAVASWVFVGIAAVQLGVWGWLVAAYFTAAFAMSTRRFIKAKRIRDQNAELPIRERQEQLMARYQTWRASPRRLNLNKMFWRDLVVFTVPKAALCGYALHTWWPLPVACAVAALPPVWPFVSRLIRNDRLDPAMSLMLTPRGPEGLPTPEV